jgi:hypothetical protein
MERDVELARSDVARLYFLVSTCYLSPRSEFLPMDGLGSGALGNSRRLAFTGLSSVNIIMSRILHVLARMTKNGSPTLSWPLRKGGSAKRSLKLGAVAVLATTLISVAAVSAQSQATADAPSALSLVAGPDASQSCLTNPCASVSRTQGGVQVSLALGIAAATPLQAATYYTDLLRVVNPTNATLSVTSLTVEGVSAAGPGDFGAITVYYCLQQSNDPSATCAGSFSITGQAQGTVFAGNDLIPAGGVRYIEFVGFAGAGASPGDRINFGLQLIGGDQ